MEFRKQVARIYLFEELNRGELFCWVKGRTDQKKLLPFSFFHLTFTSFNPGPSGHFWCFFCPTTVPYQDLSICLRKNKQDFLKKMFSFGKIQFVISDVRDGVLLKTETSLLNYYKCSSIPQGSVVVLYKVRTSWKLVSKEFCNLPKSDMVTSKYGKKNITLDSNSGDISKSFF